MPHALRAVILPSDIPLIRDDSYCRQACLIGLRLIKPRSGTPRVMRYDMLMGDPFMELPIMCTRLGEYISHSPTAHVTRVHVCKIVHGLKTDRAL